MVSLAYIQTGTNSGVPPEVTEIFTKVCLGVGVSGIPGRAKMQPSVEVKLKARASPVRVKQCPLRICDYRKIKEIIDNFWSLDYLCACIPLCGGKSIHFIKQVRE